MGVKGVGLIGGGKGMGEGKFNVGQLFWTIALSVHSSMIFLSFL